MALDDFTGQNIQETYQRVVQTDGTNFADGTGSALHIITADQTASFLVPTDTASFVTNSDTASFLVPSDTASFLVPTDTASFVTNSDTASFVTNSDTASFVVNSQTSSIESNLQSAMTVTLGSNFGGITNGTTFNIGDSIEGILRQMLVQYQVPTLNSLGISGLTNTLEVGETDTATGGTFTTGSDSNNAPWASLALTLSGVTFNNLTFSGQVISFDDVDLRLTSPGTKTFFLNGTDEEGTTTTTSTDRTDSIVWRNPIFFGGSSNAGTGLNISVLDTILSDISGSGTGTGLAVSGLASNDDQTLINRSSNTDFPDIFKITLPASVANASNFTYIVYPTSYGELSTVLKNNVQDETGTFGLLGEASHSRHGNEINYNVYKSAGQNAFAAGDSLTLDDE